MKRFCVKLECEEHFTVVERLKSIPTGCNVTLPAMREARLISEGKIPSKSFNSVDDLIKDLMSDADD